VSLVGDGTGVAAAGTDGTGLGEQQDPADLRGGEVGTGLGAAIGGQVVTAVGSAEGTGSGVAVPAPRGRGIPTGAGVPRPAGDAVG
jgi:hypothetical protein